MSAPAPRVRASSDLGVTVSPTFFTANLDGSSDTAQAGAVLAADADVLLLTEVPTSLELTGYVRVAATSDPHVAANAVDFGEGVAFAAIYSRIGGSSLPCPDSGTAAAEIAGLTMWASVLPWRSAPGPWSGDGQIGKARSALTALLASGQVPSVWGGDWNQEMSGARCYVGSKEIRAEIDGLLVGWQLELPTRGLDNKLAGPTIDHIAVGTVLGSYGAEPVRDGFRAKEHYGYVVRPQAPAD